MASAISGCGCDEREPQALATARFGTHLVSDDDIAFGDDDGVLFVAAECAGEVLATAHRIWQTEREQACRIRAGETLRQQTAFDDYDPARRRSVVHLPKASSADRRGHRGVAESLPKRRYGGGTEEPLTEVRLARHRGQVNQSPGAPGRGGSLRIDGVQHLVEAFGGVSDHVHTFCATPLETSAIPARCRCAGRRRDAPLRSSPWTFMI